MDSDELDPNSVFAFAGDQIDEAQDIVGGLFAGIRDLGLGAQATIRSVVGDVTDVPGEVASGAAEAAAGPATAAVSGAFTTVQLTIGGAAVALIADQVLNGGRVLKTLTG